MTEIHSRKARSITSARQVPLAPGEETIPGEVAPNVGEEGTSMGGPYSTSRERQ